MAQVSSIKINPEWLYHRVTENTIDKIVRSGGICSRKKIKEGPGLEFRNGCNGKYYISLAKKMDNLTLYNGAYRNFIDGQYALVVDNIDAIKTITVNRNCSYYRKLCNLSITKRYSVWADEYQVKDFIPLENIIGIKIPNPKSAYSSYCVNYDRKTRGINIFLEQYDSVECNLPFIDIEEGKRIEKESIKEYILKK